MKHAAHPREGRFLSMRAAFSLAAFAVPMVAVVAAWWASSKEEMAMSTADTAIASSCISPYESVGVPPSLYQWFELQDPVFVPDEEATTALQAELEEVRPWLDEATIEQVPNGMSRIAHRGAAAFSLTNTVQVFPETVAVGDDVVEAYELASERGPGSLVVAVTVVDEIGATSIADSFYRTGNLLWPLMRCPDNGVLGQSELADTGALAKGAIPVQDLLEAIASPLPGTDPGPVKAWSEMAASDRSYYGLDSSEMLTQVELMTLRIDFDLPETWLVPSHTICLRAPSGWLGCTAMSAVDEGGRLASWVLNAPVGETIEVVLNEPHAPFRPSWSTTVASLDGTLVRGEYAELTIRSFGAPPALVEGGGTELVAEASVESVVAGDG